MTKIHKCRKGHPCKGRCIPKTSICRDELSESPNKVANALTSAVGSMKWTPPKPQDIERELQTDGKQSRLFLLKNGNLYKTPKEADEEISQNELDATKLMSGKAGPRFVGGDKNGFEMERLEFSNKPVSIEEFQKFSTHIKELHKAGFVHADIDNRNLLRTEDRIVLLDYGLAKKFDKPIVPQAIFTFRDVRSFKERFGEDFIRNSEFAPFADLPDRKAKSADIKAAFDKYIES